MRIAATIIAFCLLLSACGNKGDLYIPDKELTEKKEAVKQ